MVEKYHRILFHLIFFTTYQKIFFNYLYKPGNCLIGAVFPVFYLLFVFGISLFARYSSYAPEFHIFGMRPGRVLPMTIKVGLVGSGVDFSCNKESR